MPAGNVELIFVGRCQRRVEIAVMARPTNEHGVTYIPQLFVDRRHARRVVAIPHRHVWLAKAVSSFRQVWNALQIETGLESLIDSAGSRNKPLRVTHISHIL